MNEQEWLGCEEPIFLQQFLKSNRKHRLAAAALARFFVCGVFKDDRLRTAIEAAESYADGRIDIQQLTISRIQVIEAISEIELEGPPFAGVLDVYHVAACAALDSLRGIAGPTSLRLDEAALGVVISGLRSIPNNLPLKTCEIIRHMIPNPFRPNPPLPHVSTTIRDLAEAVYQQDRVAIAPLHDALLDAGLTELANHFRDTSAWHPKGCWAIDLLTGRT